MPSLATYGVNTFLRLFVRRALGRAPFTEATLEGHRATLLKAARRGRWPASVVLTETTLGNRPTERLAPNAPELANHAVLYLHGGGYIVGAPALYRPLLGTLAERLGAPLYAPAYRLAPEHPYPAALDDAYAAYQALLAQGFEGSRLALMGDSAGGNLVLALLQRLRDEGAPLPQSAVLLSPWADLAGTLPSRRTQAKAEAMLPPERLEEAARAYAGALPLTDPRLSVIRGAFTGLPPLMVHVGTAEILRDDSRAVAAAAEQAGVPCTLTEWPRQPHVFPAFFEILPEGRAALEACAAFILRQWLKRNAPLVS